MEKCYPHLIFHLAFPGFHKVMEGIEKAIELGYSPVKVFCSFLLIIDSIF